MRVDADAGKGELGHVGAADQDGAGGPQTRDNRRVVLCRGQIVERLGAGQGGFAGNVEQVLDRHWQSGEWRGDIAGCPQAILGIGCGTRAVAVDFGKGARPLAGGIGDPGQRRLDKLAAGGAAGREILGKAHYVRLWLGGGSGHEILARWKESEMRLDGTVDLEPLAFSGNNNREKSHLRAVAEPALRLS